MKKLILVNKNDKAVGEMGKVEAHLGRGKRHRAFTAILKNKKGQVLMTKRSLKKPLWPTFWDVSFSSHPWVGESLERACVRRAKEELGVEIQREKTGRLFSYEYHERWSEVFSEHEINHILLVTYDGELKPSSKEISEYKWINYGDLRREIKEKPEIFVPWFKIAIEDKRFRIDL